jgi:hypothetical protein
MQAFGQTAEIDSSRLLVCVDRMLEQQPDQRAAILRRLRELQPELYTLWLMRAAAAPKAMA